jgi:hypothetical protein
MLKDIAKELLFISAAFATAIPFSGSATHDPIKNITVPLVKAAESRWTVPVPTIATLRPTFEWTAAKETGAVYELIICEGVTESHGYWIAGKTVHHGEGIATTRYTPEQPLSPNTIYVWSVRSRCGDQTSKWAEYMDGDWSRLQKGACRNDILRPFKTPGN